MTRGDRGDRGDTAVAAGRGVPHHRLLWNTPGKPQLCFSARRQTLSGLGGLLCRGDPWGPAALGQGHPGRTGAARALSRGPRCPRGTGSCSAAGAGDRAAGLTTLPRSSLRDLRGSETAPGWGRCCRAGWYPNVTGPHMLLCKWALCTCLVAVQ